MKPETRGGNSCACVRLDDEQRGVNSFCGGENEISCSGGGVAWDDTARGEQADGMNACLHQHTSDDVLADLKVRWAKAGKPSIADRSKIPKF